MDINQVLMDYDNMFGTHSLEDIEEFLTTNIEVAMDERDYASALSLLNEMMGLCRDTNQNAKGLRYCADIEVLFPRYHAASCGMPQRPRSVSFYTANQHLPFIHPCIHFLHNSSCSLPYFPRNVSTLSASTLRYCDI